MEKSSTLVACPYLPLYVCSLVFPSLYLRVNINPRPFTGKCSSYKCSFLWADPSMVLRNRYRGIRLSQNLSNSITPRKGFVWIIWLCLRYIPCEGSVLSAGCGEGRTAKACAHWSLHWITLTLALCMSGTFFSETQFRWHPLSPPIPLSPWQLFLTVLPK